MRLTWSDLFELVGVGLLLAAAGMWDLRALLAVLGALLVVLGYFVGAGEEDE